MSIKIIFGVGNTVEKSLDKYPSTSSILNDHNLAQFMGFGNNVETYVNGLPASGNLSDGDTVEIRTKASSKGI